MEAITIGLDIAKNVFQVHGVDEAGEVVIRTQQERCGRCRGALRGGDAALDALRGDQDQGATGGFDAASRDQPTTLWMDPYSTGVPRLRGALTADGYQLPN